MEPGTRDTTVPSHTTSVLHCNLTSASSPSFPGMVTAQLGKVRNSTNSRPLAWDLPTTPGRDVKLGEN